MQSSLAPCRKATGSVWCIANKVWHWHKSYVEAFSSLQCFPASMSAPRFTRQLHNSAVTSQRKSEFTFRNMEVCMENAIVQLKLTFHSPRFPLMINIFMLWRLSQHLKLVICIKWARVRRAHKNGWKNISRDSLGGVRHLLKRETDIQMATRSLRVWNKSANIPSINLNFIFKTKVETDKRRVIRFVIPFTYVVVGEVVGINLKLSFYQVENCFAKFSEIINLKLSFYQEIFRDDVRQQKSIQALVSIDSLEEK